LLEKKSWLLPYLGLPPQPPSLSYPTLALAYTQGLDEQTLVASV
jgi:hypothetical protein